SACLGSTPRRIVKSTVSSNLAYFTFCKRGTASCSVYERASTAARAFPIFFPNFLIVLLVSHRRPLLPEGRGIYDCGQRPPIIPHCGITYAVTSIPMERAVPFTLLIAASTEAAFRSGIFCRAISRTCFSVTLPTLSLFGVPEPL